MASKAQKKKSEVARAIVLGDASRTVEQILLEAGVSEEEYAAWLADAEFATEIESLTSHAAEAEGARVMKALSELAKEGDVKLVRLYFDLVSERKKAKVQVSDPFEALKREIWGDEA